MLHIVNGVATLNLLDRTDIRGARVSGDDIFAEGPVQDCLETPASWRTRADHLQKRFNIPKEQYLQRKEERERSLRSFAYHEEVVLWFEFDLFCQLNLLFLLHWFAKRPLGNSKLTLICPGEFPGHKQFRGLGTLSPRQLTSLFEDRVEVTDQQKKLAEKAWSAYSSADPTAIERLLEQGTEDLRYLHKALFAHLERFPSTLNGLNSVEIKTLEAVQDGPRKFPDLFSTVSTSDTVFSHGMGDVQFSAYLSDLADGDSPLLRLDNFPGILSQDAARRNLGKCTIRITDLGKDIVKGRQDNITVRGIDRWLGGVHLKTPDPTWRWDPSARGLVSPGESIKQVERGGASVS
ncbi:MAG: RNA polymerase subunit sigma-24 [Acidobacteria bacterium]|nr:MAG: RNA polymerase subunit sigma-24 [Acidobacteriota bacterium]